jgi:F-type H+-transporting ATPase subunit b
MTLNIWTFVFQVFNFLILVGILHWLLYRPLRQAIDRRREANAKAQSEAAAAREEAAALQQRLNAQLAELDHDRQDVIRKAREQAEAERKAALADAERVLQRRRDEVEQRLERDRVDALQALRTELVRSAVELAERILAQACNSSLQRQLAGRLVEELERIPEDDRRRLRGEWEADDSAVVETAAELNGETLQSLNGALESLAGRPVRLSVQSQPTLVGGLRLRVGGHVWDASLAGGLEAIRATSTRGSNP